MNSRLEILCACALLYTAKNTHTQRERERERERELIIQQSMFASLSEDNVVQLLPLLQEYQIEILLERAEEFLLSQASSVRNYLLAHKFNLTKLMDSNLSYMKRAPISRIKNQPEFDQLDHQMLVDLLVDKCDKFESNMESLREVRMVLERKKPTTFPGKADPL